MRSGYLLTRQAAQRGRNLTYLDSAGRAVLEPDPVQPLVQVDGVLAGHDLAHGGPSLLSLGRHSGSEMRI